MNDEQDPTAVTINYNDGNSDDNKENDMGIQSQNRKKATTKTKNRPNHIVVDNKAKKNNASATGCITARSSLRSVQALQTLQVKSGRETSTKAKAPSTLRSPTQQT
jgi:hypothetical protein